MKIRTIILSFLFAANTLAQGGSLIMTNLQTQKERVIKENKRIRITTTSGEKFQGRYRIVDENTIVLDGEIVDLSDIITIRRHPLFNSVFIKVNLVHIGAMSLFLGSLGTALSSATDENGNANVAPIVGGALLFGLGIYGGAIKSPNLNKGYHIHKSWDFKIIMTP